MSTYFEDFEDVDMDAPTTPNGSRGKAFGSREATADTEALTAAVKKATIADLATATALEAEEDSMPSMGEERETVITQNYTPNPLVKEVASKVQNKNWEIEWEDFSSGLRNTAIGVSVSTPELVTGSLLSK
jgi:hypothetical protein